MQNVDMKRGDAFGYSNEITEDDGITPITGMAETMKSQIRDRNDNLICELTITESEEIPGTYLFVADGTDDWLVGTLYTDIQFMLNGKPKSTPTIAINVGRDITK